MTKFGVLYSFFWEIPQRLNFMWRRFGTLCSIFIDSVSRKNNRYETVRVFIRVNLVPVIHRAYTTREDGTECSETSAHKIQVPGDLPKETMQHSDRGESL